MIYRSAFLFVAFFVASILTACGEKKETATGEPLRAPDSLPGLGAPPSETGAAFEMSAVPVPSEPNALIEVWPRIWLRSAEASRIGYRVDVANTGDAPTTVTFVGVETKSMIHSGQQQERDGSMTMTRELELRPGDSKRILGGDFPLQLDRPINEGEIVRASIRGTVHLKDAEGTAFSVEFAQTSQLAAEGGTTN